MTEIQWIAAILYCLFIALMIVLGFIVLWFHNMNKIGTVGHYCLGRGRLIKRKGNTAYLDCGCVVRQVDRKEHTWYIEIDFENCMSHVHTVKCVDLKILDGAELEEILKES